MRAYVCTSYTRVWYCSIWCLAILYVVAVETRIMVSVQICARVRQFCILASPAIWWRSVELVRGSVTFGSHGRVRPEYSKRCVCGGMFSSTSCITRVTTIAKLICVPVTISRCPLERLGWVTGFPTGVSQFYSVSPGELRAGDMQQCPLN
jgi:hypothetical protein